ncbi:MAG: phosphoglycerate dehydrogenase [Planctomycetota bacterium]|nr:MAG: phosphoglycerate dehydrogenase [Planctomycetota bacterium]
MPKVIVLDPLSDDGIALLESAGNIEYEVRTGLKGEELKKALAEFDGAICRSGVKITADVLEGNRRLRAIVRAGVGTDNIDKEAATANGIVVMNTPGGNTVSTAEHTIALMMALSRNICPAYRSLCEGRWDRKKFMGTEVNGKTLGIIGLGRVGRAVAARAAALEMKVVGYDPFLPSQRAKDLGIETVDSLDELLPLVDYLTVHTPLTDETRGMIGREQIAKMKPGVRLINCARGGIFDDEAVLEALDSGHVAGVALDVYPSEPCTESPFFNRPNVVCTPHLGASTEEAQSHVAVEAAELLINYFATGAIRNAVNMAPLDPKSLESIRGHLDVAYRLGLLLGQLDRKAPSTCRVIYEGEVAKKETRLLSAAFAAGLLENVLDQSVNLVNAMVLLQQRGIKFSEERSEEIRDFGSLITAEVSNGNTTVSAAGTVFGKRLPRLVAKGGFRLESPLEGTLLVTTHSDVPGVIGKLGEILGRHQVNIAYLSVGRANGEQGGEAIGVLSLDSYPPAEAIAEILKLEPIKRACVAKLPPAGELPSWLGSGSRR